MTDNIGIIENYLAWRTSHDGESRDVSPTAYYEHLENLKNAETIGMLRALDLETEMNAIDEAGGNISTQFGAAMELLESVQSVLNGETDA